MKEITVQIKELRFQTGAGIMDCRTALEKNGNNMDLALAYLHDKAAVKAAKRSDHQAQHGFLEVYQHGGGRIAVMLEIYTETEFASRSEVVKSLARELALHITSAGPLYVRAEDIPGEVLAELAQTAADEARRAGKPENIVDRIVQGRLEKYRNTNVLLRQGYMRDESITVADLVLQSSGRIGEKIEIRRFARWEIMPDIQAEPAVTN